MGSINFPALTNQMHRLASARLDEIITTYLQIYKGTVELATFKRRAGHLAVFMEYVGNRQISDVTRALLSEFWDDLPFIPPQKDVRPEFKHWKLADVLKNQKRLLDEDKPFKGLSKQTQAHYREAVSGFYEWCSGRDIVNENIATGNATMTPENYRKKVANTPREGYTTQDLKRIFEHEFYRQAQYAPLPVLDTSYRTFYRGEHQ